jgi:hypothetical protein
MKLDLWNFVHKRPSHEWELAVTRRISSIWLSSFFLSDVPWFQEFCSCARVPHVQRVLEMHQWGLRHCAEQAFKYQVKEL